MFIGGLLVLAAAAWVGEKLTGWRGLGYTWAACVLSVAACSATVFAWVFLRATYETALEYWKSKSKKQ
jgi:hypothetical protein